MEGLGRAEASWGQAWFRKDGASPARSRFLAQTCWSDKSLLHSHPHSGNSEWGDGKRVKSVSLVTWGVKKKHPLLPIASICFSPSCPPPHAAAWEINENEKRNIGKAVMLWYKRSDIYAPYWMEPILKKKIRNKDKTYVLHYSIISFKNSSVLFIIVKYCELLKLLSLGNGKVILP